MNSLAVRSLYKRCVNRQSLLLLKGREDADHGRDSVDVDQYRRTRVTEIRQALDHQQPIVFAQIGPAVSQRGRGIAPFGAASACVLSMGRNGRGKWVRRLRTTYHSNSRNYDTTGRHVVSRFAHWGHRQQRYRNASTLLTKIVNENHTPRPQRQLEAVRQIVPAVRCADCAGCCHFGTGLRALAFRISAGSGNQPGTTWMENLL
jgi:hypothetical protein